MNSNDDVWLWCPDWFPATPGDEPCASFFEHGTYVTDTDYKREGFIGMYEDAAERLCNTHESTEPDEVSPVEWAARLERARDLAEEREWSVPTLQAWDDKQAMGDRVLHHNGAACRSCKAAVALVEIDHPEGPRRKLICEEVIYRRRPDRVGWQSLSDTDLERSNHTNDCMPWLPPNH